MKKSRYGAVLLLTVSLVAAACGQKAGVHVATGSGGGLSADGGLSSGGDGGGGSDGSGGGADGEGGGGGGSSSGGDSSGSGGGGGNDGGSGSGPGSGGGGGGSSATGKVWGKVIVIGIHAPITGAAPLPSTFAAAAKGYADYINKKGGINGRTIQVEVVDDTYQPATATQRCNELVKQKNAFLLIGGGGTDQIQACARYAESAGVPYLSAGVTEIGLRGLKGYFAVSMSYKQQGAYLAKFIKQTFPDKADKPAMVYSDTPNFKDAVEGFTSAYGSPVKPVKLPRTPSSTDLANAARDLCTSGVKVAYPLMAPKDWITLTGSQSCDIQWSGVGLTMGLNAVASTACKTSGSKITGSTFFSPFPGVDKALSLDPEFAEAVQGKSWDDIYAALWAVSKATGELLRRTGPNLTRASFVATAANAKDVRTGMNPVLNYSPSNHFGADTVHVLKLACNGNQGGTYQTTATFARY